MCGGVPMSDLGSLSECLVDNDPAARVRARRLRSKALVLSVALEALHSSCDAPLAAHLSGRAHRTLLCALPSPPYSWWRRTTHPSNRDACVHTRSLCRSHLPGSSALRWFVRRRQKIVRRRRTLAWTRAAEAKERACQAQGRVSQAEQAIASSFPNRRTPSRLTFERYK